MRFSVITGISGSGKTTAIQKLIKKYRKSKNEIYYMNFKREDGKIGHVMHEVANRYSHKVDSSSSEKCH